MRNGLQAKFVVVWKPNFCVGVFGNYFATCSSASRATRGLWNLGSQVYTWPAAFPSLLPLFLSFSLSLSFSLLLPLYLTVGVIR